MRLATLRRFAQGLAEVAGVCVGLLLGSVVPALQAAQLPPLGIGTERWGWDGWFFLLLGVGLGLSQTILALIGRRGFPAIAIGLLATLAPALSFVLGIRLCETARQHAYDRIAHAGDRLVSAVESHVKAHGRPPNTLSELADHTVQELAVPGYLDGRRYKFTRNNPHSTSARKQIWVITSDDPSTYKLFTVFYNQVGDLMTATSSYEDSAAIIVRFDPLTWDREPNNRIPMSADLARGLRRGAIPLSRALEALGPPRYDFVVPNTSWSIAASLFKGRAHDAVLYYSPDGGLDTGSDLSPRSSYGKWVFLTEP